MPCRASPPPPPPPHSSLDLTPSPAPLSNPLVYRLRTCCLQEFLPRVSIKQKRSFASSSLSTRPRTCACPCSTQSSTTVSSPCCSSLPPARSSRTRATENNHTTRPCASFSPRPSPTQLSLLVQNNNPHTHCNHNINNFVHTPATTTFDNSNNNHYTHTNHNSTWLPPMSNIQLSQLQSTLAHHFLGWSLTENNRVSDEQFQKNDACSSSSSFCSSSIESEDDTIDKEPRRGHSCTARTPVLDTATASDMEKDWAETHELLWPEGDYYMAKKTFIREGVAHLRRGRRYVFVEPVLGPAASYLYPRWSSPSTAGTTTTTTTGTSEATTSSHLSSTTTSATRHAAAGGAEGVSFPTAALSTDSINSLSHPDHGAADGDENSTSNNGYLVTPHGGPRHENDEDVLDANEQDKDQNEEGDGRCQDENPAPGGRREGGEGLEKVQEEEQGHNEGDRVLAQNDESVTEDRASAGRPLQQLLLDNKDTDPAGLIGGERFEKEDSEETMATGPNGAPTATSTTTNTPELSNPSTVTSTTTTASAESSSTDPSTLDNTLFDSSVQDATLEDSYPHLDEPSLEPYSPLLDPATDGQDQFEYGLYELQYIPKIQYLHPDQFLPTRQSFIVHLDEDRPTLASPVPTPRPLSSSSSFSLSSLASSSQSRPLTRTECRCQLMMRKALMQQDLLQVWPPVAPIRTLQERLQDAEEEARMMEIKQKVQLQTMHWRKALMTQTVVCG